MKEIRQYYRLGNIETWQRQLVLIKEPSNIILDGKIEIVRDFWRNKIVEGGSRSGKMLRASLIRK